jgi:hypothetical protein
MGEGCSDCGRKGGCDARKGSMFGAIDEALARLYPTRRWSDRDETAAFGAGAGASDAEALARVLGPRLAAAAFHRAGSPEETCDWVYVLCVGRAPSLFELREGHLSADAARELAESIADHPVRETYLRIALSTLARFAAVQEVELGASGADQAGGDTGVLIHEAPRAGVFSPTLLPRMRGVVTAVGELGFRHLDFGDITEPPAGFDPGDYATHWDGVPGVANYLFYPQPPASIVTATVGWRHA